VLNILGDGIPIVYYGQEQALDGSNDPLNREALWLTGYRTTDGLVPIFTRLNKFRNYLVKSKAPKPFITTSATYTLLSSSVISVRKADVVLVLTNTGKGVVTDTFIDGSGAGSELIDVLTCCALRADGNGRVDISLDGEPMVLYPKSLLSRSGVCGL
jgi:alpha-amylase